MCANLKYTCIRTFVSVQFKFPVYGHTQTYIHTYTCDSQCNHASVGLAQAHPNKLALTHGITTVWNAHTQPPERMAQLSGEGKLILSLKYCKKEQAATGDHPAVVCQKTLFKERWCHMNNRSRD